MTNDEFSNPITDLENEIALLVEKFGRGKILTAFLLNFFKAKGRPPDTHDLSDRMRRDIGLPEHGAEPAKHWWGMRF